MSHFNSGLQGAPYDGNFNQTQYASAEQPYYRQEGGDPYITRHQGTPYAYGESGGNPYFTRHKGTPYAYGDSGGTPYITRESGTPYAYAQRGGMRGNCQAHIRPELAMAKEPPPNRCIYSFCPNTSNPWHECSEYCLRRYGPKTQSKQVRRQQPSNLPTIQSHVGKVVPNKPMQNNLPSKQRLQIGGSMSANVPPNMGGRMERSPRLEEFKRNLAAMGYSYQDIINKGAPMGL